MPIIRTNINTFKFLHSDQQYYTLTCKGKEEIDPQMTPVYATLGDSYEKVRTDLKVHHKQYTGALTSAQREKFYDLVEAEKVWHVNGEVETLITILSIDFNEIIPHNEPIGLMFEWIVADENKRDIEDSNNSAGGDSGSLEGSDEDNEDGSETPEDNGEAPE